MGPKLVEEITAKLAAGGGATCSVIDLLPRMLKEYEARNEEFPYKTEQNLRTFLKIYPNTFIVQGAFWELPRQSTKLSIKQSTNP